MGADILCVNAQSELGQQGVRLVRLIRRGDLAAGNFAINHMAMHGLMRAVKDTNNNVLELTAEQLHTADEKMISITYKLREFDLQM